MLAGVTQVTTYLVEHVLFPEQQAMLVNWLANCASETDASGRVYFAQLGANVSVQDRFVELMHIAGQEFMEQKAQALQEGKGIL
jgi:hypothetical protein